MSDARPAGQFVPAHAAALGRKTGLPNGANGADPTPLVACNRITGCRSAQNGNGERVRKRATEHGGRVGSPRHPVSVVRLPTRHPVPSRGVLLPVRRRQRLATRGAVPLRPGLGLQSTSYRTTPGRRSGISMSVRCRRVISQPILATPRLSVGALLSDLETWA